MSRHLLLPIALLLASTFALNGQQSPPSLAGTPSDVTAQEPAAAAPGDSATPDFAQARRLLQQGQYDAAITQLNALTVRNPSLKGLSHELGAAYYKKGDYIQAIDSLKKAAAEDPHDTEAIQLLGLSYYLSGRPADAIPYLEKVQTWYPRANVDASYILGLCYLQSHDYPNARKAFATMFDVGPDSAASYLFTARMLLRQEFDPIAEEYAQKASRPRSQAASGALPAGRALSLQVPHSRRDHPVQGGAGDQSRPCPDLLQAGRRLFAGAEV